MNDNSTGGNDQIIVRKEIITVADLGTEGRSQPGNSRSFPPAIRAEKSVGLTQLISIVPMETGAAAAAFVAGKVDAVGVFAPSQPEALKLPGSQALLYI
jgi:NitT/TauT family transport system substrate-binding protein